MANPLHRTKKKDLALFIKIACMMNNKDHLTLGGLNKIRSIKQGINP